MDAVVFENDLEAKAAFALSGSNLVFKCNQCGDNHRIGSKAAQKCLRKAKYNFAEYRADPYDFTDWIYPISDVWSYWGRELEAVECFALRHYMRDYLWHHVSAAHKSFEPYMLALQSDVLAKIEKENFDRVSRAYKDHLGKDFMDRFNRMIELTAVFERPQPPSLSFPVVADFFENRISCGDGPFVDFKSFFARRVRRAVNKLEDFLKPHANIDDIVMEFTEPHGVWHDLKAGYFLSRTAYLIVIQRGVLPVSGVPSYRNDTYAVFCLEDYWRPRLIDVFVENGISSDEMIDRLKRLAKAA